MPSLFIQYVTNSLRDTSLAAFHERLEAFGDLPPEKIEKLKTDFVRSLDKGIDVFVYAVDDAGSGAMKITENTQINGNCTMAQELKKAITTLGHFDADGKKRT